MPSETTTAADLIQPEVWGPAIMEKVIGRAAMMPLVDKSDTLVGVPGDTVSYPKFAYIGDAVDLTEGVAMETRKLTMTEGTTTIKEAGTAIEITDKAILTSFGRPQDQATNQLSIAIARKMDTDIRAAAESTVGTSPAIVGTTFDRLSWDAVTYAIEEFGDEWDPNDMAAIMIHSAQHGSLLRDANFVGMDKIGAGSVVLRGQVGALAGVPVVISNRTTVTVDTVPEPDENVYHALLLRRGWGELTYKRYPVMEKDRDILARTNVVTIGAHYAVKRLDDSGVVVLKTKALAAA